ncbi:MAG TPA: retroviral-like aspartic protease family protein [Vicinamibacterales bacterium]|jgi:Flp pilus assembly protein TadD/predicted aspartyl protease|nr:retroviral-like aspartic protease family protein [Vicinamibacterales bacterium]
MRAAVVLVASTLAAMPFVLEAQAPRTADVQLQFAKLLMNEARYRDAVDAYRRALALSDGLQLSQARTGLAQALLRTGDFASARQVAETAASAAPADAAIAALYGDTLWASGLFDEAEHAYAQALAVNPAEARAHHGRARALAAHNRLDEAFAEAQEALRLAPREGEFHHTVGVIYERQRKFDEAAAAFANYLNLLPNRDRSDTAAWTKAEIRFLDDFHGRTPIDMGPVSPDASWTVPVRIVHEKVIVKVRVNKSGPIDFVLDTGAEQTVLTRDLARSRGVLPITYIQSAGVGDVGLRGLQVGRIDTMEIGGLTVRNVPCLIKNPPLGNLPSREPESFSPLALGLSMRIDYQRQELVLARTLPDVPHATTLPLRIYRLATVRGIVNGRPASFVVDTGGEVISISQSTAGALAISPAPRRIPLRVYGMSGWDKDAFLLPGIDLQFSSIEFRRIPVVVLNLDAPSALLGFDVGGIVGHKFLSRYRVSIDMTRSILGLDGN